MAQLPSTTAFNFSEHADMGATLKRRGECFRWRTGAWFNVLQPALAYGWCPEGTKNPRGTSKKLWNGDYLTPQNQQVTSVDAAQLAQALEAAVADISQHVFQPGDSHRPQALDFVEIYWQEGLADCAAFCRKGAFRITDDVCDN